MITREYLEGLTIEELENIKNLILETIRKKREVNREYEFQFEATNDPRKGIPYVAKLTYKDGKINREFYNLPKTHGKNLVTVQGKFTAKENDIVEIRKGGSWKNDYRYWYLVRNGELVLVANIKNSKDKARVEKYLRNEITAEELLLTQN
jgi:hypothetical protein